GGDGEKEPDEPDPGSGDAPEIGVDVESKLKDASLRPRVSESDPEDPDADPEWPALFDPMPAVAMRPEMVDRFFSTWRDALPAMPKVSAVEQTITLPSGEGVTAAPLLQDGVSGNPSDAGTMALDDVSETTAEESV